VPSARAGAVLSPHGSVRIAPYVGHILASRAVAQGRALSFIVRDLTKLTRSHEHMGLQFVGTSCNAAPRKPKQEEADTPTRARFSELRARERLVITSVID
jgi:hypothetical protein